MRIEKLALVVVCSNLGVIRCTAQIEEGGSSKKDSVTRPADLSYDLDRRLERWRKDGLLLILICPQVISPSDTPFALPGEKKKLSVLGFGKLEKKDADTLVSNLDKKEFHVPRLVGGFHAELYFLCSKSQFSPLDKLTCYISNGFVDVRLNDEKGRFVWVGLPDKCSRLIESNFLRSSTME